MTAAALVRTSLLLTVPAVQAAARDLWSAPGLRERYAAYLGTMHHLIRASVPLMRTALDRSARLPAGDTCGPKLAAYLERHIVEEEGHDDWLLEDLAVMGAHKRDAVLRHAPAAAVAALAGAQYYWIHHYHPACLLGYIAVLEGCPPDADVVAGLPARTGWPAAAFRTLAEHAALDPGHSAELDELIEGLPLDAPLAAAVARSAAFTADRAAALLRGLVDHRNAPASRSGRRSR